MARARIDPKTLERALARHALQQRQAKPLAEEVLELLRGGGGEMPEVPEYSADLPDCYPYTTLPDRSARQLAFLVDALPDKAAELQGLWLTLSH